MKGFFIVQPGRTDMRQVDVPVLEEGEVLLKVRTVGLCGSDLNTFRGKNPLVMLPRIPGHEIAATIEKVGKGVPATFDVGMNVTVSPYTNCGECSACVAARPNACRYNQTLGVQRDGALTAYIAVPWQKLFGSESLSLKELALVEPLTVGFHAADRGSVTRRDTVAVFGCGAIGLGAVAGCAFRGASVIAVDLDDEKLELAEKIGARHTVNASRTDLHDRLQALTQDEGPSVCIEAVGLPQTFVSAVEEVAYTGRVVFIGYASQRIGFDTTLFVKKELDLRGSRNALNDFEPVIELLERGSFPVDDLVTKVYPFAETDVAFRYWDKQPEAVTRLLIEMD